MSYRFPQIKDEPADQWGRAFTCMIDAEEEGKLDYQYRAFGATLHPGKMSYSDEKRLPSKVRLNMLNVQTMGEHLYLLGYLDKKPSENEPDLQESATFQKAVRKFQKEANLTVDGWIGDETWRAMHSLVGFESDTNIKQWQEGENTFCQAFYRAVQLRLWAYGMTKEQPTQKFDGLKEHAKKNFKEILWSFGALKRDENVSDFWLFSQLFDGDALLKMASASHDGHGSFFDEKLIEEKQKASLLMDNDFLQFIVPLKGCFIANLVKIEIWLLGGEAKIDGTGDYPVEGLGEWEKQDKYNHWDVMPHVARDVTRDALLKYWHETLGAKKNIRAITPEFLNSFLDPQSVKERTDTTKEEVFKDSDYSKK
jgi:peptidoglycan hydrolase-like protein with peptidoglycan-binding domain